MCHFFFFFLLIDKNLWSPDSLLSSFYKDCYLLSIVRVVGEEENVIHLIGGGSVHRLLGTDSSQTLLILS